MKCFYCEQEFQIDSSGSGGKNRKFCYQCIPKNIDRATRNNIRRKLIVKKAYDDKIKRGCDICGYNRCSSALEWHHPNQNKELNPADELKKGTIPSYQKYKEETEKCILVCANCHREIHEGLIVI